MNTTNAAVGTGAIAVLGSWSEGRGISIRVVVGIVFLAVFLSVLPQRLAVPFAYLILTAVAFRYMPGIIARTGIAKNTGASMNGPQGPDAWTQGPAIGV